MADTPNLGFRPDSVVVELVFNVDPTPCPKMAPPDSETRQLEVTFLRVEQSFVTQMDMLWKYTHQAGTAAERTSLANLAHLPDLLEAITARQTKVKRSRPTIATVTFRLEDKAKGLSAEKSYAVHDVENVNALQEHFACHATALRILNETALQTMVNAWEKALSDLVRWKLSADPDDIPKDRAVPVQKILAFAKLEDLQSYLVEEEVNDFLRSRTTAEQIKYFKEHFNADLRSLFPLCDDLCEIVVRRHAVVHAGGTATSEYCRRVARLSLQGTEKPKQGESLQITPQYFRRAWSVVYAATAVLIHLVAKAYARDCKSAQLEEKADSFLLNSAFNCIRERQYEAAQLVLEYAVKLHLAKKPSELIVKVNLAQTYKWLGRKDDCKKVLDAQDWTSCSANYRTCVAVLREDVDEFSKALRIAAQEETIRLQDLYDWPVFQEMRKGPKFSDCVREAYGDSLDGVAEMQKPLMFDSRTSHPAQLLAFFEKKFGALAEHAEITCKLEPPKAAVAVPASTTG